MLYNSFMKLLILLTLLLSHTLQAQNTALINYGKWDKDTFEQIIKKHEPIDTLSAHFLNTPYKSHALIGDANTTEKLVANLSGVDCFTYIDYLEAIKRADDMESFLRELKNTRYIDANVSFSKRKHFFTDWLKSERYKDVTQEIGKSASTKVTKYLNRKNKKEVYLKGIPIVKRHFYYIPSKKLTKAMLDRCKSGDYIGIYRNKAGLDVSHVGVLIKKDGNVWFRNASSLKKNRKVVDSDFRDYLKNKVGFMLIRTVK